MNNGILVFAPTISLKINQLISLVVARAQVKLISVSHRLCGAVNSIELNELIYS